MPVCLVQHRIRTLRPGLLAVPAKGQPATCDHRVGILRRVRIDDVADHARHPLYATDALVSLRDAARSPTTYGVVGAGREYRHAWYLPGRGKQVGIEEEFLCQTFWRRTELWCAALCRRRPILTWTR